MSKTVGKKQATRTCVACGRSDAKQGLVRFVRAKDGKVSCDASGRSAGRGAYLCVNTSCFALAKQRGRLARALKCQINTEDYQRLEAEYTVVCADREQMI